MDLQIPPATCIAIFFSQYHIMLNNNAVACCRLASHNLAATMIARCQAYSWNVILVKSGVSWSEAAVHASQSLVQRRRRMLRGAAEVQRDGLYQVSLFHLRRLHTEESCVPHPGSSMNVTDTEKSRFGRRSLFEVGPLLRYHVWHKTHDKQTSENPSISLLP